MTKRPEIKVPVAVYLKADDKLHALFHDRPKQTDKRAIGTLFDESKLEFSIREHIACPRHQFYISGWSITPHTGRHPLWKDEQYAETHYPSEDALAGIFAAQLEAGFDKSQYHASRDGAQVTVTTHAKRAQVMQTLDAYVKKYGQHYLQLLTKQQFLDLFSYANSRASESDLVRVFYSGQSISDKGYSAADIVRFSRLEFKRHVMSFRGDAESITAISHGQEVNRYANIMNLYRRVCTALATLQQGTLFQ